MIPTVRATIVAPEPLLRERSFLRLHNRCSKEALREQGLKHHKERMPLHFTRSAAGRYNHQRRRAAYMRYKARVFRSVTDLVKTGQAKLEMLTNAPKIRVGGQAADAEGNARTLKLSLTMPFHVGERAQQAHAKKAEKIRRGQPVKTRKVTTGVTIAQMRKELATITQGEARDIADGFGKGYGQRLAVGLAKAPRLRKKVRAARSI